MLVAVVDPLLVDQAVLHVEDDHALPLEVISVALGGSLQQRNSVLFVRDDVVKLQALRPPKGLSAPPEELEDLLRSAIDAAKDVAADVVQRRVGRVERGGLRVVGSDRIEVAPDELGGRITTLLHVEQATLYEGASSMPKPYVNFSEDEFLQRQERVRRELAARDLDGLLISRIEDQHWLCGLDTDGFVIFHIMFIGTGGELTHVTRTADLASIDYSSLSDDVRVWEDAQGNPKSKAIKEMLESHGMAGKRVGIQLDTFGLLPALHLELREALDGWCELVDASDLVRLMRLVKSPAELEHHRQAGRVLDHACARAIELTAPGADEGHVLAEVYRVIWEEGADIPANRMPMGHGDKAMNVRYVTGRGSIGENDQVTFEMGDAWRHYHVADMFTVLTGPKIDPRHLKMHEACVEALDSVQAALRPGRTLGEVFEAHRATLAAHGFEHAILKACGYTMGATFPPTWMEQPMIYRDNPLALEPNMVFFTHMILSDQKAGLIMSLGKTSIVTNGAPEVITHVPREAIIRR